MPVDELDRVRRANPVPQPPGAPPLEHLRSRLDAQGGGPPRARVDRRLAARVAVALAASVAIAVGALVGWPSAQTDVLAAVYRTISPSTGTMHMQWQTRRYEDGRLTSTSRVTVWDQPQLGRSRTRTRNEDHTTGRVTHAELAVDGSRARWWSSRRPAIIREFRERTGQLGAWDGGIAKLRLLYRNGALQLAGRASGDRWELHGEINGTRLVAYVSAESLAPIEIRQESGGGDGRGTSLSITRYSIFRHERDGLRLSLELPGRRGLPVVPWRTPR